MAKSKREGGLYWRKEGDEYIATDAEGNVLESEIGVDGKAKPFEKAPARKADTEPALQPGATGAVTSEERIGTAVGLAVAKALGGGTAKAPVAAPSRERAGERAGAGADSEKE